MNWALTYTFNFNDTEAQYYDDFDVAKAEAIRWSECELGAAIYLWKLTTGNPIKWMRVSI